MGLENSQELWSLQGWELLGGYGTPFDNSMSAWRRIIVWTKCLFSNSTPAGFWAICWPYLAKAAHFLDTLVYLPTYNPIDYLQFPWKKSDNCFIFRVEEMKVQRCVENLPTSHGFQVTQKFEPRAIGLQSLSGCSLPTMSYFQMCFADTLQYQPIFSNCLPFVCIHYSFPGLQFLQETKTLKRKYWPHTPWCCLSKEGIIP